MTPHDPVDDLAKREDPYNVANASRIFILPNLMTAANLFCGFMAIVNCVHARLAESSMTGTYLGGLRSRPLPVCGRVHHWSGRF